MCGRTPLRQAGTLREGDMAIELVHSIATQIPKRTVVQFHWNGEPTMHPQLGTALSFYRHCITGMDTNGKLLMKRAHEIIGNIDTLTLSVIQDDPEGEEQWDIINQFLILKGDLRPEMVYRLLGNVDPEPWKKLPGRIATRILHAPEMSRDYEKPVTIPEMGICLDMLHTVAIDFQGNVHHCVRFDPQGLGRIGELTGPRKASLEEIVESIVQRPWHIHPRQAYIDRHIAGQRHMVPLCAGCDFYGVPTGRFEPYGRTTKSIEAQGAVEPRIHKAKLEIPSRPRFSISESAETPETGEVSESQEQDLEQATGEFDKLACEYCAQQGKEFIAKSPAGLASHIRMAHERRFRG